MACEIVWAVSSWILFTVMVAFMLAILLGSSLRALPGVGVDGSLLFGSIGNTL